MCILLCCFQLDNAHNPTLLLKYKAHINVEWCNQSRAIKYLFKYINKGQDKITAALCRTSGENGDERDVDEIQEYYNCRYVSTSEASWRILGFDIHHRTPSVERLSFHLPGEHTVVFNGDDTIDDVLSRTMNKRSMFMAWMECNRRYEEAKNLLYSEFPICFVWQKKEKVWTLRKRVFSIVRLYHVAPGCRERYYLRTLLNFVKGPISFEDIKTVNGVIHPTFKDACYSMGLLDDDKEYIDGITKASF